MNHSLLSFVSLFISFFIFLCLCVSLFLLYVFLSLSFLLPCAWLVTQFHTMVARLLLPLLDTHQICIA